MLETIFVEPLEASAKLAQLGIRLEVLQEALRRGQLQRDLCTENHPTNYPGMAAYGETNGTLRELLVMQGWSRCDRFNICKVVAPDGSYAVTAVSGDEHTGEKARSPMTRRPRGAAGITAVQNNLQYCLFPDDHVQVRLQQGVLAAAIWYLLFLRDGDRLRAELSLPTRIDEHGNITSWIERILLPEIDLSGEPADPTLIDVGPEIEVPVTRRA